MKTPSGFFELPILCDDDESEVLQGMGINDVGGEWRMGYCRRSSIVCFYPANEDLINIELENGLKITTNLPMSELLILINQPEHEALQAAKYDYQSRRN